MREMTTYSYVVARDDDSGEKKNRSMISELRKLLYKKVKLMCVISRTEISFN